MPHVIVKLWPGKSEQQKKQLPLNSRRNCLPVKCIYWSLVMRHKHSTRALVELSEIGKAPSGANPVLHHPPETFDRVEVVPTMGR